MARNAEKAMTALARWHKMLLDEAKPKKKRPHNCSECDNVRDAKRFRLEVIGEISKKISQIQNPGLGEFKIRDVNDEINKLLRIKGHWEVRIKELGGPDYLAKAPKWFDREGHAVPGMGGYKYFGAAKDLPGVREIIEAPVPQRTRKTHAELMRYIDADYYGYMDDDDGVLIPLEQEAERLARAKAVEEYTRRKEARLPLITDEWDDDKDIYRVDVPEDDEDVVETSSGPRPEAVELDDFGEPQYIAHVPVPSQKEVEQMLVQRRKMELLAKYASDSLRSQSLEASTLMGYKGEDGPSSSVS